MVQSVLSALIAVYLHTARQGEDASRRFAFDVWKALTALTAVAVLFVELCAPWLARLIAPSYPAEQIEIETAKYRAAATAYSNARQAFKEKLPRELVSEFEKLKDYEDDYGNESDFITFRKGFQLGMQLAVAGLEKDRLDEALKEE